MKRHLIKDCDAGSPPRVRSRPHMHAVRIEQRRITSACAEQTLFLSFSCCLSWDHLRVCGADLLVILLSMGDRGSPPRVRSRQLYFTVF